MGASSDNIQQEHRHKHPYGWFYHHTTSLIALDGCTGIQESHVVCSLFVVSCMWFAVVELNSINRTPWNVKISVCTHLIKNGLSSHLECVIFMYLLQIPLLNTMQKPFPIYLHEKIFDFYINTTYCNKKNLYRYFSAIIIIYNMIPCKSSFAYTCY